MRTSSQFLFSLLASLAACGPDKDPLDDLTQGNGPNPSTPGSSDPSGSPTTNDPTGDPTGGTTTGDPTGGPSAGGVDILFVIDNSGSMAEEQARLAQNIAALVDALGDRDVRIGITTTDNGNPRCPNATYTPEGGNISVESCVQGVQEGEFTFNMNDFSYACTDYCQLSDLGIVPTTTQYEPDTPEPRPWLERIGGVTNFDPGVTLTEALQCTIQRGVAGCGFESPLEAAYKALALSGRSDSLQYGFLRDDADLVVVLVTDEMDCSANQDNGDIFTTNKIYWNDPADPAPTSALCFRAGVECQGGGPTYESCAAVDKDANGNVIGDPMSAVLVSVSKYTDYLTQLAQQKANYGASFRLLAIAGVPVGFEDGLAQLVFEDSPDIDYQLNFGIGPGCELADPNGGDPARAVPPMRMLDVAQAFGAPRFFSICQEDYSAALAAVGGP